MNENCDFFIQNEQEIKIKKEVEIPNLAEIESEENTVGDALPAEVLLRTDGTNEIPNLINITSGERTSESLVLGFESKSEAMNRLNAS